uniref:Uncharacterized protein n=1 Tax=Oryza sativa subsp. japonica TaxID=39947 RepID=Q33AS7_ORYSJ|nr:hypothetical protein LOC_Os10g08400 [Oryza sativa Japonica Group]
MATRGDGTARRSIGTASTMARAGLEAVMATAVTRWRGSGAGLKGDGVAMERGAATGRCTARQWSRRDGDGDGTRRGCYIYLTRMDSKLDDSLS